MALKNIGVLSPEAIKEFQKQKFLMLNRGGEVWVEECDFPRATEILSKIKNPVDQIYRFHGCLIRMPKEIVLEQKWYGYPSNSVGRRGRIHIHEMAKPTNGLDTSDRAKTVNKVKIRKEEINLGTGVFPPGYAGIVMCDDDGIPLFEVTAYNIWVLFDPKSNTEAARKIYDYMLMFAIVLANHSDEKSVKVWNDIWAQQAPEREKWEIKQFEDMVVGSMKREMKALEDQVNRRQKSVSQYQQSLYAEAKALSEDAIRLDVFKTGMAGNMEKKAREEWDKLKGLERNGAVRNIRVTADRLSFQTREIKWTPAKTPSDWPCSEDGGKVASVTGPVRLGVFEISVYLGGTFGIEIVNQTKTLTYKGIHWHHPHIQEGNVCKGNMTDALPTFAAKRDFEAIMMCMLKWLENVDTKDAWGRDIYYWIVDDNKRKQEEIENKKRQEEEEKRKAEEAAKAEAEAKKKAEEAKVVSTASAQAPEAAKKEEGNGGEPASPVPAVAVVVQPVPVDTAKTLQIKL